MEKVDLKQQLGGLYAPSAKDVVEVDVPTMSFLMIDGRGDPNTSQAYAEALDALYAVSYALKFAARKAEPAVDYGVMPLEGLWWTDDMADFSTGDKSAWNWTAMIMQPEFITAAMVASVTEDVAHKKDPPALPLMRFEAFSEGLCAQTMHIGPFAAEAPTIIRVHEYIETSGRERRGLHHEIYLSDIRRADPSRWRTIIRQPMQGVAPMTQLPGLGSPTVSR